MCTCIVWWFHISVLKRGRACKLDVRYINLSAMVLPSPIPLANLNFRSWGYLDSPHPGTCHIAYGTRYIFHLRLSKCWCECGPECEPFAIEAATVAQGMALYHMAWIVINDAMVYHTLYATYAMVVHSTVQCIQEDTRRCCCCWQCMSHRSDKGRL